MKILTLQRCREYYLHFSGDTHQLLSSDEGDNICPIPNESLAEWVEPILEVKHLNETITFICNFCLFGIITVNCRIIARQCISLLRSKNHSPVSLTL